jgi:hypothetical protein
MPPVQALIYAPAPAFDGLGDYAFLCGALLIACAVAIAWGD